MWWQLIRRLPKLFLVLAIFGASTSMFLWWRFTRPARVPPGIVPATPATRVVQEDMTVKRAAQVEARMGHLFMVGEDLYDVDSGEVVFPNWLRGANPSKVYYDVSTKTVIGRFKEGVARYTLDGRQKAVIGGTPFFLSGGKKVIFAKGKDVWLAVVDWDGFRLVAERQVTKMGIFNDRYFTESILLASERFLLARGPSGLIRVDLESGETHPAKVPLQLIVKAQSPDALILLGEAKNALCVYNVDSDQLESQPMGRLAINSFRWLDNDRCAMLGNGTQIIIYNRKSNQTEEGATISNPCHQIGSCSPGGRYLVCAGKKLLLVDLETKRDELLPDGTLGAVWIDEKTLAFAREMPDSTLRGTWLKTAGGKEQRISTKPFFTGGNLSRIFVMKADGVIIFSTNQGVMRIKLGARSTTPTIQLFTVNERPAQSPLRLTKIEDWVAKYPPRKSSSFDFDQ